MLAEDPARVLDEIQPRPSSTGKSEILYLTDDEHTKLKIPRGSLDDEERKEIESHVDAHLPVPQQIPWTKEMRNIPAIACGHHEKLDGHGYPRSIRGEDIPCRRG